jgi:hypothetical protein
LEAVEKAREILAFGGRLFLAWIQMHLPIHDDRNVLSPL